MAIPGLRQAIMAGLREFGEGVTSFDRNAVSMLTPVSRTAKQAERANQMFWGGANQHDIWGELGVTTSPTPPSFVGDPVWLRPRGWGDTRLGNIDELGSEFEGTLSGGGYLSEFAPNAPVSRGLMDRTFVRMDPEIDAGAAQAGLNRSNDPVVVLGTGAREGRSHGIFTGAPAPPALVHEMQHVYAFGSGGRIPDGTNLDDAAASPTAQKLGRELAQRLKRQLDAVEDAYWRNPGRADLKEARTEFKAAYERALSDPEYVARQATLSAYQAELGEALARWAQTNSTKTTEGLLQGPAPFSALDYPLWGTLHRGDELPKHYENVLGREREIGAPMARRLAKFFGQAAPAGAGLGLAFGASREALRDELNRDGAY